MAEILVMPKMGLTAAEATLVAWHHDIGEEVVEGDVICDVETDKIANEVESTASGTLLKRIDVDQVVPIGEPIAVIGAADEDVSHIDLYDPDRVPSSDVEPQAVMSQRIVSETTAEVAPDRRTKVSPAARRRAGELAVDLDTVAGSGPGGRITLDDVEVAASTADGRRVELTPLRRAVARNMTRSASVPQFSLERESEIGAVVARLSTQDGEHADRVTVVDVLAAVLARRLRTHDRFLCSWDDDHLVRHESVDIGMAVALDEGLMVPVVRGVDTLSLNQIARNRRELQSRARDGELTNEDVGGAVFTITNLGPFGVDRFTALVDPPQSGILAVGRIRETATSSVMSLTLSADHRVVDGADGARLLHAVAAGLTDDAIDSLLSEGTR